MLDTEQALRMVLGKLKSPEAACRWGGQTGLALGLSLRGRREEGQTQGFSGFTSEREEAVLQGEGNQLQREQTLVQGQCPKEDSRSDF